MSRATPNVPLSKKGVEDRSVRQRWIVSPKPLTTIFKDSEPARCETLDGQPGQGGYESAPR